MSASHLRALQKKHRDLESRIEAEMKCAARNDQLIRHLKTRKLDIKRQMELLRGDT